MHRKMLTHAEAAPNASASLPSTVGIFRSLAQTSSKSVSTLIGVRRGGRPTAATRHWGRDHGLKSSPRGRPKIFILEQKILKLFPAFLERREMNGQK